MITKEDVKKCARLARIKFEDNKLDYMVSQVSRIMEMIDTLKDIDVKDVEPLTSVVKSNLRSREDKVTTQNNQTELFSNVPGKDSDFAKEINCYIVPKVVE